MKIIETYICLIPIINKFVKVNVGKVDGKNMYFMEIDGRIDEISGMYFMSIKKVD